jgi:hypothetical protein
MELIEKGCSFCEYQVVKKRYGHFLILKSATPQRDMADRTILFNKSAYFSGIPEFCPGSPLVDPVPGEPGIK